MTRDQLDQILATALDREPWLKTARFTAAEDFGDAVLRCAKSFIKLSSSQQRQLKKYAVFML